MRAGHMAETLWRHPSPARTHIKLLMPAPTRDRPGRVGVFSLARAHIGKCRSVGKSFEKGKTRAADLREGPPRKEQGEKVYFRRESRVSLMESMLPEPSSSM